MKFNYKVHNAYETEHTELIDYNGQKIPATIKVKAVELVSDDTPECGSVILRFLDSTEAPVFLAGQAVSIDVEIEG